MIASHLFSLNVPGITGCSEEAGDRDPGTVREQITRRKYAVSQERHLLADRHLVSTKRVMAA